MCNCWKILVKFYHFEYNLNSNPFFSMRKMKVDSYSFSWEFQNDMFVCGK